MQTGRQGRKTAAIARSEFRRIHIIFHSLHAVFKTIARFARNGTRKTVAESTTDMVDDGLVWIHVTESSSLEGMVFEDRKYEGT